MLQVLRGVRTALRLNADLGLQLQLRTAGTRLQHSAADKSKIEHYQPQNQTMDPFTSALQSKTEKELMDQMLRQAEEQERVDDAAEQVWHQLCIWPQDSTNSCMLPALSLRLVGCCSFTREAALSKFSVQARIEQRGEHGGPKGEEPTRFGERFCHNRVILPNFTSNRCRLI